MKIAILDLGTNTFHLLISVVNRDQSVKTILKTRAVVKLGKGGLVKNLIGKEPFEKGIRTIRHFKKQMEKHRVEKVYAYATSAIRSAKNGKEFVGRIREETGIQIKVISGDEEAELICLGVRQCVELGKEPALIMDIGGGSTEFIIANEKKIFRKYSFNIGAARLLEKFNPSDPISDKEIAGIEKYLNRVLQPLHESLKKYPVKKLVGSSGSFDTLADMIGYRFHSRAVTGGKSAYQFKQDEYFRIHDWLIKSTLNSRMRAKGLVKMRVDMIVLSSICVNYVLKKFDINEMIRSKYALKEGALRKIIQRLPV